MSRPESDVLPPSAHRSLTVSPREGTNDRADLAGSQPVPVGSWAFASTECLRGDGSAVPSDGDPAA
jgi:hypothetical protein